MSQMSRHRDGTLFKHDSNTIGDLERNFDTQYYKGIPLRQIKRGYGGAKARRFTINHTNQNCWIPLKHLADDGTIKPDQNIDYVIFGSQRQFELAGVTIEFKVGEPKRRSY